jgi:hypothetical protein
MNVPWLEENVTRRSWVMSSWHWGLHVIDYATGVEPAPNPPLLIFEEF